MNSLKVAVFLSMRSIVRSNLGVTFLTIAMLVLANLNLNFVSGLMDGIIDSANEKLIATYSSDIVIEPAGKNYFIRNARDLVKQIEAVDGVVAATYRNSLGAELSFNDYRVNTVVRAIIPEQDKRVFNIADAVYEGSYLDDRDTDQIFLGIQLAGADRSDLELFSSSLRSVHAGDKITVSYANGVIKKYTVKGVFYTEFIQTDIQAFVTERELRSVYPLANDQASVIYVKTRPDISMDSIIQSISRLRSGLQFKTWEDTAGLVSSMTESFAIIQSILMIVNMLIAGITVFIVTYIDLTQKRRQIGIERAIGITSSAISMSYLLRAVFYAVIAIISAYFLYQYGVIPLEARYPFHFPFGDVVLSMGRTQLIRSALIIAGVSAIAALLPVWQTLRIRILDAIWG